MKCIYCLYQWETRTSKPKACPRCKRRFDYPNFEIKLNTIKSVKLEARK